MKKSIYKNLSAFLSLLLIFASLAPVFAQRKGNGSQTAARKKQTAQVPVEKGETCSGWRGKITYYSSASESSVNDVPAYGKDYNTSSSVTSGEISLDGARSARGKISIESKLKKDTIGESKACCWATVAGCVKETVSKWKYTIKMSASGTGEGKVDGDIKIEGNRYKINFLMPQARGKEQARASKEQSGYCADEENKSETQELPAEDKNFPPVRIEADGAIDPKNPNVLEGSFQPDPDTMIRWNLTRVTGDCEDGDLSVADLKTEHRIFPNKTDWQIINENTVDGNQVKITALVVNSSEKSKSGTLVFKEKKSGAILGEKTVSVPGEGETAVEFLWDTNGFAWTDEGKSGTKREIEASLSNGETQSREVEVYPKPVILVHGLWSNGAAWGDYHNYLEEAHSYAWKAHAVGADPKIAQMNTGKSAGNMEPTFSIERNAQELGKQILHTQKTENAWRVDVVAHSMGGLISRYYIHHSITNTPDGKPTIKHLVMLGTPNMGSPCADLMYPSYKALGFEVEALRQLQPSVVAEFNKEVTNRKGVRFSITYTDKIPVTCDLKVAGDGVVTRSSAIWQIADVSHSDSLEHTALTGKEDFMRFVRPRLALGPKMAK